MTKPKRMIITQIAAGIFPDAPTDCVVAMVEPLDTPPPLLLAQAPDEEEEAYNNKKRQSDDGKDVTRKRNFSRQQEHNTSNGLCRYSFNSSSLSFKVLLGKDNETNDPKPLLPLGSSVTGFMLQECDNPHGERNDLTKRYGFITMIVVIVLLWISI